ncbi:MAG: ATP-binding protein [Actinomycetota bacterium]
MVLAGICAESLDHTVSAIATAMGRAFRWEAFAIGLIDEVNGDVKMVGSYGFPPSVIDHAMPAGKGIIGRAIASGKTQLICDTRLDPDYVEWNPHVRSEMTAPIRFEGKIIGVVDVEAREEAGFTEDDLARLERLTGQIGLVISSARLLSQQRAMVERLQELDQMKSDFVAVTSHELRTPLTAVQGFVRTLRRPDVALTPGEMQEFLGIVDRQVERLSRLVEELLLTARIDAGTIDLRMDSVDVSEVLEETLSELGDARRRVQLATDPSLPRIATDSQRLGQVARNLIENALKFSGDDHPVRVTVVPDGGRLLLEVADKGAGIPQDELPHIFERFHQVGGSMRRHRQGLGLGLYIVRNLVEALNGSVTVSSSVGEGSTFTVAIPLVPAAARSSTA